MKKVLVTMLAATAIAFGASAQKSTSLHIGYGGYTQMDATDCHDGGPGVNTAWGALTAGIQFKINSKITLGPSYTFSSNTRKKIDDNNFYYHAIMLNGKYSYYRNSFMTMYGKLGIGTVIMHETWPDDSKNRGYFAYQISPICADFPIATNASFFGELGFGAQGLIQVGFKLNL